MGLKDRKGLVGSNQGNIYLIEYKNGYLNTIDFKKICDKPVYSLSVTNNCNEGDIYCYTFAANCKKVFVFQIGSENKYKKYIGETNLTDSEFDTGILIILIIIIIIICICKNNCDNHKSDRNNLLR